MNISSGRVSRFLLKERWFNRAKNQVKQEAFMPSNKSKNLSVSCTADLTESEIWQIGLNVVQVRTDAIAQSLRLLGRADVKSESIEGIGLKLDRDDQPLYHANITGWPAQPENIKMKAAELAVFAKLVLHEDARS